MCPCPLQGEGWGQPNSNRKLRVTVRPDPFFSFHRSAEAAGYPALQLVTMFCLGFVLVAIGLLGLMQAAWTLAVALLSLIAAVAVLAGAIGAAFADYGEPSGAVTAKDGVAEQSRSVVALERTQPATRRPPDERKAA
jgi:hypothetical protein